MTARTCRLRQKRWKPTDNLTRAEGDQDLTVSEYIICKKCRHFDPPKPGAAVRASHTTSTGIHRDKDMDKRRKQAMKAKSS